MTWFEKIIPSRIKTERRTRSVPEGLWMKCPACDSVLYRPEVERNLQVCPKCAHHMRIGARERLARFLDPDGTSEIVPTAVVVWRRERSEGAAPGMGLQFLRLDRESARAIETCVYERTSAIGVTRAGSSAGGPAAP